MILMGYLWWKAEAMPILAAIVFLGEYLGRKYGENG
jgi:hypothetical protein